jgi:CRISPR/Cas system-associated endoribonuclease Cas2
MALYLISYDISEKNNDYEELYALLKKWKADRILYSEWLVISNSSAKELADEIVATIESGDRLLVQEMNRDAAWLNLRIKDESFEKWLAYAE